MKKRCRSRPDYIERGTQVCERWENSFTDFYNDMGPRPSSKHSIERKNNDGDYEPGNCIWATRTTQNRNTRRNHFLTFSGRTQTIADWSEETGIRQGTIWIRLSKLKWSVEKTLSTPTRPLNRNPS
jgi:hypothetical protein